MMAPSLLSSVIMCILGVLLRSPASWNVVAFSPLRTIRSPPRSTFREFRHAIPFPAAARGGGGAGQHGATPPPPPRMAAPGSAETGAGTGSAPSDMDSSARAVADAFKRRREIVLGRMSVSEAMLSFYRAYAGRGPPKSNDPIGHPLVAFSAAIGARYDRLREYVNIADMPTKMQLAEVLFKAWYDGDFHRCVVDVGPSLDPLIKKPVTGAEATPTTTATESRTTDCECTIDMAFLKDLRLPDGKEMFLVPETVYVREPMRAIFGQFMKDVGGRMDPERSSTVIIGSPGVGKSTLLFLAALYQAQTKMVVFYRIDMTNREDASMFFMMPDGDGRNVRVWFSRNLNKARMDNLVDCRHVFEEELGVRRCDYYLYIDGPHHAEEEYLMEGMYDYFCTSGGFPRCDSAEREKRLWILDGWTREEAVDGILTLHKSSVDITKSRAERAYAICGGRIRDMLVACGQPEVMIDGRKLLLWRQRIESFTDLAVLSSSLSSDPGNPDALRTMFAAPTTGDDAGMMEAVQIVDSAYCLGELAKALDMDEFLRSYDVCVEHQMTSFAEGFFKHIIHQSMHQFLEELPTGASGCWTNETPEASASRLNETGVYWIFSAVGAVDVDSALVSNHTLNAFRMTVEDELDFDVATFRAKFASPVSETLKSRHPIKKLVLHVVVPAGSRFNKNQLKFTEGTQRMKKKPRDLELRIHRISMLRTPRRASIFESIGQILVSILQEPSTDL